jgi:hypothetical protein
MPARRFYCDFRCAVLLLAGATVSACGGAERPPRIEDDARSMTPVPACVIPLPARRHGAGTMRTLKEEQYWELVFPAYDAKSHQLPLNALTCTGNAVFNDPILAGGKTRGSPLPVQEGDIFYGNGGDRIRIVWFRTHHWDDGTEAGPLALVRAKEDFAEVYAVGVYKRSSENLTMRAERLGTEVLIAATDDGCQGQGKGTPCETTVTLFLPRFGHLTKLTTLATERRAYATGSEPGVQGKVEYQLNASPQFTADGINVFEQVQATDSAGHVVHKTELQRIFLLHDGTLEQGNDSLWGRVYPGQSAAVPSGGAPAPPGQ